MHFQNWGEFHLIGHEAFALNIPCAMQYRTIMTTAELFKYAITVISISVLYPSVYAQSPEALSN